MNVFPLNAEKLIADNIYSLVGIIIDLLRKIFNDDLINIEKYYGITLYFYLNNIIVLIAVDLCGSG